MSDDRTADERDPPGWHDVLGPVRTARVIHWLETVCFALGLLLPFLAFWIWSLESTRGRLTTLTRTTAERLGFDGAIANPTETALVVLAFGVIAFVCSLLLGSLGERVRSCYVERPAE